MIADTWLSIANYDKLEFIKGCIQYIAVEW